MNERMDETGTQVFTFRGRSMRDVVSQLKDTLGDDAVIQSTQRVREPTGGYVEITARPGESHYQLPPHAEPSQPQRQAIPQSPVQQPHDVPAQRPVSKQLGAARGPGAYARTAKTTRQGIGQATAASVKSLAATQRLVTGKQTPFAERAAWLAAQIEQREQAEGVQLSMQNSTTSPLPAELQALQQGALPRDESPELEMPTTPLTDNYAAMSGSDTIVEQQDERDEIAELKAELASLRSVLTEAGITPREFAPTSGSANAEKQDSQNSVIVESLSNLDGKMGELVDLLSNGSQSTEAAHADIAEQLRNVGLMQSHAEDLAKRILTAIPDGTIEDGDVLELLEGFLNDDLICSKEPSRTVSGCRVMAFVGPTGVGKTTTIAKVASQARLRGKRVALITVDICRAAAVEQLAGYANLLNAPLEVVKEASQLTATVDRLSGHDLILIDTNGRNPRDVDQVRDLKTYFPANWGGEIVLTLACSTRESDLKNAIDAFGQLGVAKICITKTDETNDVGIVYSIARRACRPLAWTTDGQVVPDDINVAHPANWARATVAELSRRGTMAQAC